MRRGRPLGILAIALAAVLAAVAGGCRQRQVEPRLPVAVRVTTLHEERLVSETPYSATVREQHRVELSFKVPGTVVELLQVPGADGRLRDVQEGDEVPADPLRPIARLDDADYRRHLAMAEDRLAQAQAKEQGVVAQLASAKADFERTKTLFQQNASSRHDLDEQRARYDALEAELLAARRAVAETTVARQQANDDLGNCWLCVPIGPAVVSQKNIERNERVANNLPVFQLIDISRVKAAFGVPDTAVGRFQLGQRLKVVADAFAGETFAGRIAKIHPTADPKTRSFEIEVLIDEPRGLRPGMAVTIVTGRQQQLRLVPIAAIQQGADREQFTVYVAVEEQGRQVARQRRVCLGGIYDNRIEIVVGAANEVRDGDSIIVSGAARLVDGQEIRVLGAEESPLPARYMQVSSPAGQGS